jgi:hypothetical protein
MAEVGPGWWGLLRIGFRRVAAYTPEVSVLGVRALHGRLVFYAAFGELEADRGRVVDKQVRSDGSVWVKIREERRHEIWEQRGRWITTLRSSLADASAARCEACGAAVPPPPPLFDGRNHCPACARRYEELLGRGGADPLVRLWEARARVWYPRAQSSR